MPSNETGHQLSQTLLFADGVDAARFRVSDDERRHREAGCILRTEPDTRGFLSKVLYRCGRTKRARTYVLARRQLVELPGIEYAKVREPTWATRKVLTASTSRGGRWVEAEDLYRG